MSSMLAKGKWTYFFCLGAHQRRTDCRQPYALASAVERDVQDLYRRINLPKGLITKLEAELEKEVSAHFGDRAKLAKAWTRKLNQLNTQRDKLMAAYYSEAISLDILKQEQARITGEIDGIERQLALTAVKIQSAQDLVLTALRLAANCFRAYKSAKPARRRQYNQAFFKTIYIKDKASTALNTTNPSTAFSRRSVLLAKL